MKFKNKPPESTLLAIVHLIQPFVREEITPQLLIETLKQFIPNHEANNQTSSIPIAKSISIIEAANRLNVSKSTIWRLIRVGILKRSKLGSRTARISERDLAALIEKGGYDYEKKQS